MAARVDVLFCFRCEWWAEAGCGPRGPEPACPRCATPLYLVGPPGRRRAASRPDPRGSPPDPAAAPPQAGGLRALPPPRLLHTSARERWAGPGSVDVEVDVEVDVSEAEPPDDEEEVGGPFGVRAALVAVVGVLLAVAVLAPREPPPEPDPSPPAAAAPRLAPAAGPPATALVPASLRTLADAFGVRGLVFVGPEDSPRLTGDRPAGNRIWRIDLETGVVQRGPAVPAIVEIRADPRSGGERLLALSRGGTLLSTTMDPHERPARVSGDVVSFAIRQDGTVLVARAVQGDPPSGWDAAARVAVTPV
ncbi:MAG: hypothetical protein HY658_04155, partial [Actinobacteria bacterium]|nr:hypothetical protein [Actinomycetota bacterium]